MIPLRKVEAYACPKCGQPMHLREEPFFHRAIGFHPGLVCPVCKVLQEVPEEPFIQAVAKAQGSGK